MKIRWTVFSRRLHKKGTAEETSKRKSRKTVRVERAIVGASWEEIIAKKSQPKEVREASRIESIENAKKQKKEREVKKKADKAKIAASQKPQKSKAPAKSAKSMARY